MASRRYRISCSSDPTVPFYVIVELYTTKKALIFRESAISTLDDTDALGYKKNLKKIVDGYGLLGIVRLTEDHGCLVVVTGILSVGQLYKCDIHRVTVVQLIPLAATSTNFTDPRITDMQQLMSSGMFYFATSPDQLKVFDLTCCTQKRFTGESRNKSFFWNASLHFPFERFRINVDEWLLRVMCGSVQIRTVYVGHKTAKIALISRLSSDRVGTRFNVRGVNDDGCVANFVETEQLITFEDNEVSFVQVRGSVPLFWEQPGINVGSHKVKLRAFEASAPAFDRHFRSLKESYGAVTIVNLLGSKEGERLLSEAYKMHHKNSQPDVAYIAFDYHTQIKVSKTSASLLVNMLKPYLTKFGIFHADKGQILRKQTGVVRANCLDCLDRTNSVQTLLGLLVATFQLESLSIDSSKVNIDSRFEEAAKDLWQKNGDCCSVIYAGTGALEGKSKLRDASRSLARTIQNNLMDSSKQESFNLLLRGTPMKNTYMEQVANILSRGNFQERSSVIEALIERKKEAASEIPITIFAGTWNVNGGKNMQCISFRNESSVSDWLFPKHLYETDYCDSAADIYAIGLEEIVDLNASNIVKASTTNQRLWCDCLRKALLERGKYVLLASEQLVGVCMFVFIKPSLIPFIRDMAIDSVKTGMGGAAGNKGSVALRMTVYSTSVCFVCSHLAAGQNEIHDRNDDYKSAVRKIRFPGGRDILSHDVIIWFGDFNYRISLPSEEVKSAVKSGQLAQLVPNDQLTQQRILGEVFNGFEEGELDFPPTYKYDTFSDDYDTSEKCRAPAWTDRVMWKDSTKNGSVQLLGYGRVELKTSDHRPVCAFFRVQVDQVVPSKCFKVYEDVIASLGPPDGTVLVFIENISTFPLQLHDQVLNKVSQLGVHPILSKIEGAALWLIFDSGESALAALSMDGIRLGGAKLQVKLRTPEWVEQECPNMEVLGKSAEADIPISYETLGFGDAFEIEEEGDEVTLKAASSCEQLQRQGLLQEQNAEQLNHLSVQKLNTRSLSTPLLNKQTNEASVIVPDNPKTTQLQMQLPVINTIIDDSPTSIIVPPPVPPRIESMKGRRI